MEKIRYQLSPLKILQSHADLATLHLNPPPPPFAKGGRGDFRAAFQRVRVVCFNKLKCYKIFKTSRKILPLEKRQLFNFYENSRDKFV